jgi:hypothetical protein
LGNVILVSEDETRVARPTAMYPPPDITPAEFEQFVAEQLIGSAYPLVDDLKVTLHERITRPDGTYDFDATIRFNIAGMSFLVLVEAKRHKNPIKRELVQVLHQKIQSVGAHKGVMVSTAPYQSGALTFAIEHGIALVTMTEGRFLYEARDTIGTPEMSREEAAERFGVPTFVCHCYMPGGAPGSIRPWLLSPETPEYSRYVADFLLGRPAG